MTRLFEKNSLAKQKKGKNSHVTNDVTYDKRAGEISMERIEYARQDRFPRIDKYYIYQK